MSDKTFLVEIVVPYVIDEVTSKEEAKDFGQYLAESLFVKDLAHVEIRVSELEGLNT